MKNPAVSFIPFLLFLFLFAGCKKDNVQENENGQVIVEGNKTIKVRVLHHGMAVPDLPVYLKRNVTSWPGPDSSKYEFKAVTDQTGTCEFNRLFPGNYFLYAHGIDAAVNEYVIGYQGVALNSTTAPGNKLEATMMVSE